MFVFLSKLLPLLVYPLGLGCILLIAALLLSNNQRLKRWLIILSLFVLWMGGNRWVAYSLTRELESRYSPTLEYPQVEAIVVLGGGTESGSAPRPGVEINGAGDRVIHAARLYRQGIAPKLLLSGGTITWLSDRPSTPASEMEELLQFLGVPKEALWLQPDSQNTYEDALFSTQLLRENEIERIILVTSAQHMPRSVALFEAQGFDVIPAPVDFSITDYEWDSLWRFDPAVLLINFFPTVGNLSMTTSSMKEYLGLFMYALQGWL
jgi:uncharacterized SAM-binding protein YcdF (DUF218 family)